MAGVFSKFNPVGAGRGGVLLQAHPNAEPYPWQPLRTTVRSDAQWGGQGKVHRVGPQERGKTWGGSQLGSWVNGQGSGGASCSPSMGSGCGCGCGKQGMPLGYGLRKRQ
jgi:hypothetical protein